MRVPSIRQRDITDCGAACLQAIAAFHGTKTTVARIRQAAATDQHGTTVFGLIEAAHSLGLAASGLRAPLEALPRLPLPAIVHLVREGGLSHFAVLIRCRGAEVRLMDPAQGRRVSVPLRDFAREWSGVAVLLAPAPDRGKVRNSVGTAGRFWALVRPHRSVMIQSLVGAVVYTALGLCTAIYVQKVVDHVLRDGNANLLNLLTLGMLLVVTAQTYIGAGRSFLSLHTAQRIDAALILGYYKHLLGLPQRFFDTMRVGEVISRVGDAVKIRAFINDVSLDLVVNILVVLLSLGLMLAYSPTLALLVLCALPLYAGIFHVSNRVHRSVLREAMERGAELESHLVESVSSVATLRRYGLQGAALARMEQHMVQLLRSVYAAGGTIAIGNAASGLVTQLVVLGTLFAGARLVLQGELTPGQLMSFYALVGHLTGPASQLVGANRSIQDALIAGDRLFEILDLEIEEAHKGSGIELPAGGHYDVVLEDVTFGYSVGRPVLVDLSLELPAGQVTAVVGESGSGKSTVLALIQGVYAPGGGHISIGGYGIHDLSRESLRRRVATVPQEIHLFAGSLLANIAAGENRPDVKRVIDLCRSVGLEELIHEIPGGLHARLGEHGVDLSGGQRQLVALARALYRQPDILGLDEATANLDSIAESRIRQVIATLRSEGRTIVIVAHRLSSVVGADRIVLLSRGRAVEAGTHAELLQRNGGYAALWYAQHGGWNDQPLHGAVAKS